MAAETTTEIALASDAPAEPAASSEAAAVPGATVMAVLSNAMVATMLDLGRRTGLTAALGAGPVQDAEELAERAGGDSRIAREWLRSLQAAGLVVETPDGSGLGWSPDAADALGISPWSLAPGVELFSLLGAAVPMVAEAFARGGGVGTEHYPPELHDAMQGMSAAWTQHVLPEVWVPALPGIVDRLAAGGSVAEIGCASGHTLEALARHHPRARMHGFELDRRLVDAGERRLAAAGHAPHIALHAGDAAEAMQGPFDLVLALSVLHDVVDLEGMLTAIAASLAPDGRVLVVESTPFDGPLAAMLLATSTLFCVPTTTARGADDPAGTLGLPPDVLADAAAGAGLVPDAALPHVLPLVRAHAFRRGRPG